MCLNSSPPPETGRGVCFKEKSKKTAYGYENITYRTHCGMGGIHRRVIHPRAGQRCRDTSLEHGYFGELPHVLHLRHRVLLAAGQYVGLEQKGLP